MSLERKTQDVTLLTTDSQPDFDRMEELFRVMSSVGLAGMSTRELEEWSYLMARSLAGKGDGDGPTRQV